MIAPPFTARQCPICKQWIYCANGPFAEDDPTKTLADWYHYDREHRPAGTGNEAVVGFPFFDWNDEPVEVTSP
jgi:hypothetical protein